MNRLTAEHVEQPVQGVLERQSSIAPNDIGGDDDDIFIKPETNDDDQAHIRRRAPTRHSIKSLTGRKTLTKQNSATEVT
jgi:hypothetical protein